MKKLILIIVIVIYGTAYSLAAPREYSGQIISDDNYRSLAGATVSLLDTARVQKYQTITDKNGIFKFAGVENGKYILRATYVGCKPIEFKYTLTDKSKEYLGMLSMITTGVLTPEVIVEADAILGEMIGDTAQYNAGAFKVDSNAYVDELLKKIPGVKVESDGKVKANGREVEIILVDGRVFFSSDPNAVLKNIPAKIVDKVQVYDKATEKNEFIGNDAEKEKTAINLVIKEDKKIGYFGSISAGGGTRDRYETDAFVARMNGVERTAMLGALNNTNQSGVSSIDSYQFSIGDPEDNNDIGNISTINNNKATIATNKTGGISYANDFWIFKKTNISYLFKKRNIEDGSQRQRDYFPANDSSQVFFGENSTKTDKYYHRFAVKANEVELTKRHGLQFSVNGSHDEGNVNYSSEDVNSYRNGILMNDAKTDRKTDNSGNTMSGELTYRYKFDKPGRTFGVSYNIDYNDLDGTENLHSMINYFSSGKFDTLWQRNDNYSKTTNNVFDVSAGETFSEHSQLTTSYTLSLNNRRYDRFAYDIDGSEASLDTSYSNQYTNDQNTNEVKASYKYKNEGFTLLAGARYKNVSLNGENRFPYVYNVDYSASKFLPDVDMSYKIRSGSSTFTGANMNYTFNINYKELMNVPTIFQLRGVLDNSNPLWLSIGNPYLKVGTGRKFGARVSTVANDFSKSFSIDADATFNDNTIANSLFTAQNDTVLGGGIALAKGVSLSRPVNLGKSTNYGISCLIGIFNAYINVSFKYTNSPTLINDIEYNTKNQMFQIYLQKMGSFFQNKLFVILNVGYLYNTSENSAPGSAFDNAFHRVNISLAPAWKFSKSNRIGFSWNSSTNFGSYYDKGNYNNYSLNLEFQTAFFNDKLELKLLAVDVLRKTKSVSNITYADYSEFIRNEILKDYVILKLSYKFNTLGASSSGGRTVLK